LIHLFLVHGANVIITGQNQERLNTAFEKLKAEFSEARVHAVKSDVRQLSELDSLTEQTKQIFEGHLDILFVNAGLGGNFESFEEVTEEVYDNVFNVNAKGSFFTVQKLAPLMSKGSSIVFNLSTIHSKPAPILTYYAGSKAAPRSLVRSLALSFAPKGIRVNSVSPGLVLTELAKHLNPDSVKGIVQALVAQTPMGRVGEAIEIANAVLFLASDEASFVTGTDLYVDGGLSC